MGADAFIERAMKAAGQTLPRPPALNRIVGYVCQRIEIKEKELAVPGKGREAARARALIGWLAMRTGAAPLTEVARRFNRDLSTLSRAVGALQRIASAGGPVCVSAQAGQRQNHCSNIKRQLCKPDPFFPSSSSAKIIAWRLFPRWMI